MLYDKIPTHIAIIMDGNGRWARNRNLLRINGHKIGVRCVKDIVTECVEIGIKYLTLYSFSEENWQRPKEEIYFLMHLLNQYLVDELPTMMENKIQLLTIGNGEKLPKKSRMKLEQTVEKTKDNNGMKLILALSYGSRQEIVQAVRETSREILTNGKLCNENEMARLFTSKLYTSGIPDPDLLIRTGGELRISNFLLWQMAYTEIYVTDTLWPDFTREELILALDDYGRRERRFGRIYA